MYDINTFSAILENIFLSFDPFPLNYMNVFTVLEVHMPIKDASGLFGKSL